MKSTSHEIKLKSLCFTIFYVGLGLLAQWILFSKTVETNDLIYVISGIVVFAAFPSFLINFIILYSATDNTETVIVITHLIYSYVICFFLVKYIS